MKAKLCQAELQLSASQQAQQALNSFMELGQILLSNLDASSAGLHRAHSPPEAAAMPHTRCICMPHIKIRKAADW